ncbi:MAG: bifunctional DNA-formamidopyrimidine glycosylase/DNA-(apurinic or apyrimidinic site) lyase [Spirochaetaceae bacterium]|nr:bifunctional DNA-formamidopyrimidine glycosylase/DNA-(apurinic or apyrimidinic site) lyase [Spirochaetaceae bacterium]
MPELPEVETIKNGLSPLIGRQVTAVNILDSHLRRTPPADLNKLVGQSLLTLERRAKYIIMQFNQDALVVHLGMTGKLLFDPSPKHDRVSWHFTEGQLYYNDVRRFGYVDWLHNINFNKLGIEPLTADFTADYLFEQIKSHREAIKLFLLSQDKVVGLGNIYVCEALFMAKISPFKSCNLITYADCTALVPAIKEVLTKAITLGGSTLRDYRLSDGGLGGFQDEFLVYGRSGEPCFSCGTAIERTKQGGRSSFYCPKCQAG